jgi:hypothetical protein
MVADKQATVYQQTKNQVDALSYVTDLADKVLPASEDQSAIVSELTTFATRAGLPVSQISFKDDTASAGAVSADGKTIVSSTPKGVKVVPVTVQFDKGAKYTNLLDFLRTVEANQRKSQVTNINLTPDATDRSILSQVSIDLNLYSRQAAGAKK